MDRRTFLTGAGTLGGIGAAGTGTVLLNSRAADARAKALAQAAGAEGTTRRATASSQPGKTGLADGLTLGYLPGSAGMLATPANERAMRASAAGLRWARWDAAATAQVNQSAIHSLFKSGSIFDVSIGVLRTAPAVPEGALTGLEVVAHFAIDDAPYFVPFSAWRYQAAGPGTPKRATQPISFTALAPNRVGLEIGYALRPSAAAGGVGNAGQLYFPLGADAAATRGLATGLYILAAPSAETGVQPDLGGYAFTGDVHAPIAHASGRAPDFDYLTLAIRPVAL